MKRSNEDNELDFREPALNPTHQTHLPYFRTPFMIATGPPGVQGALVSIWIGISSQMSPPSPQRARDDWDAAVVKKVYGRPKVDYMAGQE